MHVIVVENEPSSFRGGQELSIFDISYGLYKRGHQISLLYIREGNLLKQYEEFCQSLIQINNYRLNGSTPISSVRSFLTDIFKIPKSESSLIYSHHYHDSLFASAVAVSKNIPFVCHIRLPPPQGPLGSQWSIGLKGVKRFITVSNQTKLDWVERGFNPEKFDVVYNGIKPEVFKPSESFSKAREEWNIPEDIKVISYVGRLDKEKGIETLLKAFALLVKNVTNTRLLIAGKPLLQNEKYKESLEQLSSDLGIKERVTFLGHISDTISLYRVSDVTVLPSINSEPFGRVVIESMSCGTPVVASRIGGIPEILTGQFQSGLFEAGNEQDLASALQRIMNWRNNEPQLSEKCREHILQKFSLETTIDGIEKILLNTVSRQR